MDVLGTLCAERSSQGQVNTLQAKSRGARWHKNKTVKRWEMKIINKKTTIIIKSNLLRLQMATERHKSKSWQSLDCGEFIPPPPCRQLKKRPGERALRKLLKGKLERPFSDLSSEASRVPRTCKRDRETGRGSQYIRCQELCLPLRPTEGAAFQMKKRKKKLTTAGAAVYLCSLLCVCARAHGFSERARAPGKEAERAFSLNNAAGDKRVALPLLDVEF